MAKINKPRNFFLFSQAANMKVKAGVTGPVLIFAKSLGRGFPNLLEITGDRELMDFGFHSETVDLEMFGLKFRAPVWGQMKDTGSLFVQAEPLFRALSKRLKAALQS